MVKGEGKKSPLFQMTGQVHLLMQNAKDGDAVSGNPIDDEMTTGCVGPYSVMKIAIRQGRQLESIKTSCLFSTERAISSGVRDENSDEDIRQAFLDFQSGRMERLTPA